MSVERVHRLLRLIMVLQGGAARSAADLAATLGVSRRTVFRDLNLLEEAGIPCFHERGRGYRIARSFFLPPINLTVSEAMGLMLLGKRAEAQPTGPFAGSALSGVSKLIAALPGPMREACGDLLAGVSVDVRGQVATDDEADHFATAQRCIDEGRACRLAYSPPIDREPIEAVVHPYALHFAGRAWYLFAYSESHDEVRVFKLARVVEFSPLKRRFDRPSRFTIGDKVGNAWQLIPEGREYDVELEFTRKVATNVTEVRWHPTQKHGLMPDGRCRMTFRVDGLAEIAWWVCGYAGQVKVIKPAALRKRVLEMHREAIE